MEKILYEVDAHIKLGNLNRGLDLCQSLIARYKNNLDIIRSISNKLYITGQEIMKKSDYKYVIGL